MIIHMVKNNTSRKGFTLIELLVVIAIIAILAVVVVLTLNPAQLLAQARDSNRASDFATLKSAIGLYEADVSTTTWLNGTATGGLGTSTIMVSGTTSVSIANMTSTACVTLPGTGWGFIGGETIVSSTVAQGATARAINGTGWIPIDFAIISSGAPISSLPVDPVNNGTNVYAFVGGQTTYKLATKMESTKYSQGGSNDIESTDGGSSPCTYEQGTAVGTF